MVGDSIVTKRPQQGHGLWGLAALVLPPLLVVGALACSGGTTPTLVAPAPTNTPTPALYRTPAATSTPVLPPTPSPVVTVTPQPVGAQKPVGTGVGDRAPDFTIGAIDGESISLDGLLAQGKGVILYFFATW